MRRLRFNFDFLTLGIAATTSQVVLFRNILQSSLGNELVIGLVLGIYILLSGIGSFLSSRIRKDDLLWRITFAFPLILMFATGFSLIPSLIFGLMSGEALDLWQLLLLSLVTIGGAGFVLGVAYGFLFQFVSRSEGRVSNAYFSEAVGSAIAGIVFTYFLATHASSVQTTAIVALLYYAWLWGRGVLRMKSALFWMTLSLALLLSGSTVEKWLLQKNMKGYELIKVVNSRYGRIEVTGRGGETAFFHNGSLLLTWPNPDFEHVEALSHIPIYSAHDPSDVLLIGGGPDIISEILKHEEVRHVVFAQPDPEVVKTLSDMGIFPKDGRLEVVISDARAFLRKSDMKFDVVIIDLPPPMTLTINRFYTVQFWKLLKEHTASGGVVAFTLPWSFSYVPVELEAMNVSVRNALQTVFQHVYVFSDGENLFLASSEEVTPEKIIAAMKERPVSTSLVSPEYIEYRFSRIPFFEDETFNSDDDFHPITVFYGLIYWTLAFSPSLRAAFLRLSGLSFWLIAVVLVTMAILMIPFLMRRRRRVTGLIVFTTGMAAMAFDVIPMLAFQVRYGYIYEAIGLLVALFHIGLAAGGIATAALKDVRQRHLLLSEFAILALLVAMILMPHLPISGIYLMAMLGGAASGFQFPIAVKLYEGHAGRLYAMDLFGGTLSALVVSALLIPVIGFMWTIAVLVMLKSISALFAAVIT